MSIADWFDEIRIRNIIEKVMKMDSSDYLLSPSEWRAKLLSYTDTVDNNIQQMMEHPYFIAARDWLHTTIQNVSCMYTVFKVSADADGPVRCAVSLPLLCTQADARCDKLVTIVV